MTRFPMCGVNARAPPPAPLSLAPPPPPRPHSPTPTRTLQEVLSFFATFGSTSGDIRLIQAFTFVLTAILATVAIIQPILRPRILYKGHKSSLVLVLALASSLVTKVITRLLFLPVMQVGCEEACSPA
jgi:hypothetical protein